MPILFDIDLDFFFYGESPLLEDRNKKAWLQPEEFKSYFKPIPCYFHVEHAEALAAWGKEGICGWDCWHFDAHPDIGEEGAYSPELLSPGRRGNFINSGNFLFAALREGIFAHIRWILPPWLSLDDAIKHIDFLPSYYRNKIICTPWEKIKDCLPLAQRMDLSFSPAFSPFSAIHFLENCLASGLDEQDDFVESLIAKKIRPISLSDYYPDLPEAACTHLYHGSPKSDISCLSGSPLFLSPSPAVAACFGLRLDERQGWIHGIETISTAMPRVYLAIPYNKREELNRPMTLYRVDDVPAKTPAGSLHGYEFITYEPCRVADKACFATVREALETYYVYTGVRGEVNIISCLRDLVYAMPKEVENWLEMPLDAILALPPLEPSLAMFFSLHPGANKERLLTLPFRLWGQMLDRLLLPMTIPFMLNTEGWHGYKHARQTALLAGMLAWKQGILPLPVMLAACLHDAAREDDSEGEEHAINGARIAEIFFRHITGKSLPLSGDIKADIIKAIEGHAKPEKASRPIAALLQDADRLRLSWQGNVRENLFSTAEGLALAKSGSQTAGNMLAFLELLGDENQFPLECKFEITDACNLACDFCHQGFGQRVNTRILPLAEFEDWLKRLKEENISLLRFTGGEPTVVPDFETYLGLARNSGFYITVNSNALLLDMEYISRITPYIDCLKISLPVPDDGAKRSFFGKTGLWERKLEAAAFAAANGIVTEFLTPMFPAAIKRIDQFVELLEQMTFIRWVPLRAEAAPRVNRPVSRKEMLELLEKLDQLHAHSHWENLKLALSMPFCLLDHPLDGTRLLDGRSGCGPFSSLAINTQGKVMRCYSRRVPLEISKGLRAAAISAAWEDFLSLPSLCLACPVVVLCQGGCRAPQSLGKDGFDYLARPEQARLWINDPVKYVLT